MNKRILIIEDEESIADLEKDYLELSNFEVEVANDGEQGLAQAMEQDFDLIILDLMLPGVDGFEICRQVRDSKNTPIIMVSAKKDDIDKIRGLGLGADDYMTKPFSPSELVARVKAHLARYERLIGSNVEENEIIENPRAEDRYDGETGVGQRGGTFVYDERVRSSDISGGTSEPCLHKRRAVPGNLGYGVDRGYRDGYGTYQKDPREDRVRYVASAVYRDNMGSGIPV